MNQSIKNRAVMILMSLVVFMGLVTMMYYIYFGVFIDLILFKTYLIIALFGLIPIAIKWHRLGYIFLISSIAGAYFDFYNSSIPHRNGMRNGFINLIIMISGFILGFVIEIIYRFIKTNRN